MTIFQLLKDKKELVFVPFSEESIWFSVNTPEERLLDTVLEESDGKIGLWLYRRNGITQSERDKAGDAFKIQETKQREYYSLLASCARTYQIPESDITKAMNVDLGTETLELRRQAAISEYQKLQSEFEEAKDMEGESALEVINQKLELLKEVSEKFKLNDDSEVALQQEKNRQIVAILGEDFKRLVEISNTFDKASEDYRYELAAQILSSPLRLPALEKMKQVDLKKQEWSKQNIRSLSPDLVRSLFSEFISKEMRGKNGWDDATIPTFTATYDGKHLSPSGADLQEGKIYELKVVTVVDQAPEEDEEGKAQTKS
jgi:hypothetical protein